MESDLRCAFEPRQFEPFCQPIADAFKIDRTFAQGLLESPEDLSFLSKIINLVKSRRRRVIIEGVSSAEQLAVLRGMEADGLQGFYFSKPVRAEEFLAMLERGGRLPL